MNWKFIFTFAWFYGYSFLRRGYSYVFSYLITPLSILFLVYVLSRGSLLQYAIVGGLIAVVSTNSVVSLADVVMLRKEMRIQDMLIATKVGPAEYMLGLSTANLIFSSVGMLAYVALGLLLGVFTPLSALLDFLIAVYLNYSLTGLAFIIGTLIPYTRHSWAVSGVMGTVLTIIPPVYYPFSVLKGIVEYLSLAIPSSPASVLSQSVAGLTQANPLATLLFFIEGPFFIALAVKLARWREK
ncbi:ABC transporter permease [Metallosphaera tengchongensis]|uniref:ABC transporter permease n=1 Tax=Metallosphaera tengchongensis TaxID=1532350 RepID=A0A6N0NTZ2_9CREN|nr:ABC transporter permease [Metallosphaera tengchongensis]QKR00246.1 ABC transporter permease [Metallosphaera tengchongensis]